MDRRILTNLQPSLVLQGVEEVPSRAPLRRLREWIRRDKPILGPNFRDRVGYSSAQGCQGPVTGEPRARNSITFCLEALTGLRKL